MIGVYKITNPLGQVYVGQTVDNENRWRSYKKGYCFQQRRLYESLITYGVINHVFEMVEECDKESLTERERFWQISLSTMGVNGLNANRVGLPRNRKAINNRKFSRKICGELYDKVSSAGNNSVIYDSFTGIFFDSMEDASFALELNRTTLSHYLNGIRRNRTNLKFAFKENKDYMAVKRNGPYKGMPSGIQKAGKLNMSNKPVESYNILTGHVILKFYSISQCQKEFGYKSSCISGVLKGKCKTHKGVGFRYQT